jgi:hypothetical protein
MRSLLPAFRHVLSLTVLAGVGMACLLTRWPWVQVLTVALVAVIALLMVARNALRRASRRIDTILEEELGAETDADPAPAVHRLASRGQSIGRRAAGNSSGLRGPGSRGRGTPEIRVQSRPESFAS